MRLFTAVALNNEQKRRIFEWKEKHFSRLSKSVPPDNYHITLAFFGEVQHNLLEPLISKLDSAHAKHSVRSMAFNIDQIAFWPKTGIVWIGPKQWPDTLSQLAKSHGHVGTSIGSKKSRNAYQPHITLARSVQDFSGQVEQPALQLEINNVTLFESLRGNTGRVQYQPIHQWELNPFGIHSQ